MSKTSSSSASDSRFLIVMRHAKSDWGNAQLSDHDRPLNDRGCRDAPRMARWLHDIGVVPDMILSSTSERTRETVEMMRTEWASDVTVSYTQALYLATPEMILRTIHSDGGEAERLMVLAHNPGIGHFVSSFAGQWVEMPTAAIAVFQVETNDWSQLRMDDSSTLVHYMRPKAL